MGLDMYLNKKTYVKQWNHQLPEEKYEVTVTKGGKLVTVIDPSKITYVEEEVGYWRKANQIHNWFVNNVQDGDDNCSVYCVHKKQLLELKELCKKVLADKTKAYELLPPSEGFFFGSYEIDDFYFKDLEKTIDIITELEKSDDFGEITYQSSW